MSSKKPPRIVCTTKACIYRLKQRLRRFRQWQETPASVAPYGADERHTCLNCGEDYTGFYCPRCGQSAKLRRLTFKSVMSNALDVWGMGSRSMPRALLHLVARPGYMIADYLRGHRQPYFPPFKMLFLMTMFTMIVAHYMPQKNFTFMSEDYKNEAVYQSMDEDPTLTEAQKENQRKNVLLILNSVDGFFQGMNDLSQKNKPIALLLSQLISTIGVFVFFRKSPRMGNLSFTEQFFGQVLIVSQMQLVSIVFMLVMMPFGTQILITDEFTMPKWLYYLILYIDYYQLYGYNWWKTGLRCLGVSVLTFVISLTLFAVGAACYGFYLYQVNPM